MDPAADSTTTTSPKSLPKIISSCMIGSKIRKQFSIVEKATETEQRAEKLLL